MTGNLGDQRLPELPQRGVGPYLAADLCRRGTDAVDLGGRDHRQRRRRRRRQPMALRAAQKELPVPGLPLHLVARRRREALYEEGADSVHVGGYGVAGRRPTIGARSEEHTSALQSIMRPSYA